MGHCVILAGNLKEQLTAFNSDIQSAGYEHAFILQV